MSNRNNQPTITYEEALEYFEKFKDFARTYALKRAKHFGLSQSDALSCGLFALWHSAQNTTKPYCMRYISRYVYGHLCLWAKKADLIRLPNYLLRKDSEGLLPEIVEFDEWTMSSRRQTGKDVFLAEDVEILRKAMEKLAPRIREALTLYYLEDRTLQEAGVIMGLTRERVRQLCKKGLGQLHTQFLKNSDSDLVERWSGTLSADCVRLKAIEEDAKLAKGESTLANYLKRGIRAREPGK